MSWKFWFKYILFPLFITSPTQGFIVLGCAILVNLVKLACCLLLPFYPKIVRRWQRSTKLCHLVEWWGHSEVIGDTWALSTVIEFIWTLHSELLEILKHFSLAPCTLHSPRALMLPTSYLVKLSLSIICLAAIFCKVSTLRNSMFKVLALYILNYSHGCWHETSRN